MGGNYSFQESYDASKNWVATAKGWTNVNPKRARLFYRVAEEILKIYGEKHTEYKEEVQKIMKEIRNERRTIKITPGTTRVEISSPSARIEEPSKLEVVTA